MIQTIIVFALALFGWSGLLWFGVKPDFLKLSMPQLVLLHLVPPLLAAGLAWWRKRQEQNRAAEAAKTKEEAERREREAAAAAMQAEHQKEMQWRRQGCDCRAVVVTGLLEQQAGAAPELDYVHWQVLSEEDELLSQRPIDPLVALQPHLEQAINALYEQSPAAAHFPIYLLPPVSVPAEKLIDKVRVIAQAAASQLACPAPLISYLPGADHIAQRLIGPFEQQPELPGYVVLGFDSPLAAEEPPEPDEALPAELTEQQRRHGLASQAVVLLLITHPNLNSRLAELEQLELGPDADPLLPHWERAELDQLAHRQLTAIALEHRDSLAAQPVLARIHRGVAQQFHSATPRVLELTKQLGALLQSALINAGVIAHPFEQTQTESGPAAAPANCAWLVHNAGGVDNAGARLSAVSTALHAFEIDLNPIGEGTNIGGRFGDVGAVQPLLMAALGAIRAAQTQSAVVNAEFNGPDKVAVHLTQPSLSA